MARSRGLPPSAVLFAVLFAAQASILVLSPILAQVAADFGVATSTAAQLRSVSGVTAGIAALIVAVTGGRRRLSSLLSGGLLLLAAGSLGSAVAPSFGVLVAAQSVIGLGLAMVLSGGLAASESWAAAGESARVLSWALVGQPVAWIVGQPVVGWVAGSDWRWAWVAVPFASSLAALLVVAARDRASGDEGRGCDPVGLWRQPGVKPWAIGELLGFAAWGGTLVYAGAFFVETYGASVGLTGLILGAGAAAYLPGNFAGRRWLQRGPAAPLVVFALGGGAVVAVFAAVDGGVLFSAAVFGLLAFLAAGRTIAGAALGLRVARGRRLAAMSVRTSMLQFGYLAGSVLGGVALSTWGFPGMGWMFAGLFAAAAVVPVLTGARALGDRAVAGLLRRRRSA
jgi:predicted MFS family arabinose efflux permease